MEAKVGWLGLKLNAMASAVCTEFTTRSRQLPTGAFTLLT